MSRRSSGVRLWLEPEEFDANGKRRRFATWVIARRSRKIRTGRPPEGHAGAEKFLAEYLAIKYGGPSRERGRHPDRKSSILDALNIYLDRQAPRKSRTCPRRPSSGCFNARRFLAARTNARGRERPADCRAYVEHGAPITALEVEQSPTKTGQAARARSRLSAARRELEDLRAAINLPPHAKDCAPNSCAVRSAGQAGQSRERWLDAFGGGPADFGRAWRARQIIGDKDTRRAVGRHVARFILVGLYTGTRSSAICGAALMPTIGRGHVDLDGGVFYRRAIGPPADEKAPDASKLPTRLLAHMRRWQRQGLSRKLIVEWNGRGVASVRKGFAAAVRGAGLGAEVTPHILRHTCATWLMQSGVDLWDAAGFLGMTMQQLEATYGHHHPDFQHNAARAVSRSPGQDRDRLAVNKTR